MSKPLHCPADCENRPRMQFYDRRAERGHLCLEQIKILLWKIFETSRTCRSGPTYTYNTLELTKPFFNFRNKSLHVFAGNLQFVMLVEHSKCWRASSDLPHSNLNWIYAGKQLWDRPLLPILHPRVHLRIRSYSWPIARNAKNAS